MDEAAGVYCPCWRRNLEQGASWPGAIAPYARTRDTLLVRNSRRHPSASARLAELGYLRPRLRHDAEVGFGRLPALRIRRLGLVVGDRTGDDDVIALLPVHRCCHLVLGGQLQGVDHAQDL